jgi:hypothetical protein
MRLPKAVAKLVKWVDPESCRYALGGVRIGRAGGKCFAEATDGRRLGLVEWEDKGPDVDAILEGKELGKALRQAGCKPPFHMDDSVNGVAKVNGAEVRTVEGRWPKTEELFAADRVGSQTASFTAQQLRDLARRTAVKIGETTVLLSVQYLEDLADAMDAADAGFATFKASDERSQVLAECESVSGANLTAVLMPMAAD